MLKFISSCSKHTLPCSDEHQNPPTSVCGFVVNLHFEKVSYESHKYSRYKVKPIDNKTYNQNLRQRVPNTTTRKRVAAISPFGEEKRKIIPKKEEVEKRGLAGRKNSNQE